MLISTVLIILTSVAGTLTLWRDEIIARRKKNIITDNELSETDLIRINKTRKIKIISTILITFTLIFTVIQFRLNDLDKRKLSENTLKAKQSDSLRHSSERFQDSLRFKNQIFLDSIKYALSRKSDSITHANLDSTKNTAIASYKKQLLAEHLLDGIQSKSRDIFDNLHAANEEIKVTKGKLDSSLRLAQTSFNSLSRSANRLEYKLDSNITIDIYLAVWCDTIKTEMARFIEQKGFKNEKWIDITSDNPYWNEIMWLTRGADFRITLSPRGQWGLNSYLTLVNKEPLEFIEGYWWNNKPESKGPWLTIFAPEPRFQVQYYVPGGNFVFKADKMPLKIDHSASGITSILDIDSSSVDFMFRFKNIVNNHRLLQISNSSLTYTINFSGRKNLSAREIVTKDRKRFVANFRAEELTLE